MLEVFKSDYYFHIIFPIIDSLKAILYPRNYLTIQPLIFDLIIKVLWRVKKSKFLLYKNFQKGHMLGMKVLKILYKILRINLQILKYSFWFHFSLKNQYFMIKFRINISVNLMAVLKVYHMFNYKILFVETKKFLSYKQNSLIIII